LVSASISMILNEGFKLEYVVKEGATN